MARKIRRASVASSPFLRKRAFSPFSLRNFTLLTILLIGLLAIWPGRPSSAATLPTGFAESLVTGSLTNATAMAIAPDGRIFVCLQGGQLRVIKNGALLPDPFVTLSVNSSSERGLLGVAFDPNFGVSNQFVYVYYTTASAPIHNRVSRFTASGDVAMPGSEVILLDLNNLSAGNHNGGAIHFGLDGKLYIAAGENAVPSNSQTLDNLLGKILRINPDPSNLIPSDNPFFNQATGNNRAIWALGLRNPFTFNVQPGTGRIFINDVGEGSREEINDGIAGSNYGWNICEGPCNPPNANFRDPIHSYANDASTCAITGGVFYNPTTVQFPASYVGKYFFGDLCGGFIKTYNPANSQVENFATGLSNGVDLAIGSDGSLYYLQRGGGGQLWKVQYTAGQGATVTQHPSNQTVFVGQTATFTVMASGTPPLSYQWRRNNVDIPGANSASYNTDPVTLGDNGTQFRVIVSNAFSSEASNLATLTVLPGTASGLMFYPLPKPIRLLDTRPGFTGCDSPGAPIPGNTSRNQLARRTCEAVTIPTDALAVTGNITTVQSGGGFLTLYPSNAAQPTVANSNYTPNEVLNNVFTVGLGSDGAFKIFVTSDTHVVVDVTGYYAPPGTGGLYFHPLPNPVRLLDTRPGAQACYQPGAPLIGGVERIQTGVVLCGASVPLSARAIVGNATVVNSNGGFLTLFPADIMRPQVSNSNYSPGQVMNAPFTVGLSAGGDFKIYPQFTTDLVIDVSGYYSPDATDINGVGLLFTPLATPVRLLETRAGFSGCFAPGTPITGNTEFTQVATGTCNGVTIPNTAKAVVGNATVVNSNGGFLTFWPSNVSRPLVANSNFVPGQIHNRHFTVGLGADGAFKIYSQFTTDLVVDLSGYFAP
jgi:glucose/arabinose dehydrogenase